MTILLQVSAATHFEHKESLKKVLLFSLSPPKKFYYYIYLKHNQNKVVHMKNGLTRTQFFLEFHREEKSFFWLPLGRLECYFVIIFLGFCIYSVYPRFLGLRCGCCDCFCTYDQSWSCIIVFVNMDYVF